MAAPPLPVEAVSVLPYADLPARHGVQHDVRPDGVTIVLPPPPWWKRAEVLAPLAMIPMVMVAVPNFVQALIGRRIEGIAFCAALTVALIVASVIVARHRSKVVLEVTGETVRLENVRPLFWTTDGSSPPERTLVYPRTDVYDARFVEHSGNIVIRIHGHEMIELLPSRDPRLNRWIAEQLRAALGFAA